MHPLLASLRSAKVLVALALASLVVAWTTELGADLEQVRRLTLADFEALGPHVVTSGFEALRRGELYRLVTPTLLHFGARHLASTLLFLLTLGAPVERGIGSARFAAFVLASAVLTNLAEVFRAPGTAFGGAGGLVAACVGYGLIVAATDVEVRPSRAWLVGVGIFLVGTFVGLLGPVGKGALASGLLVGSLVGGVVGHRASRTRRP